MEWKSFVLTAGIAAVIVWLQWGTMKKRPVREKGAFFVLLGIGILLSAFDLKQMPGVITLEKLLFQPFEILLKH